MIYFLYKVTNNKTSDCYFGITSKSVQCRKTHHLWMATKKNSNFVFHRAIRKYGSDSFIFESIAAFDSKLDAEFAEINSIKLYSPKYNMTLGGDGIVGMKWTEERRNKTLPNLYKAWTPERKKMMSKLFNGVKPSQSAILRWKEVANKYAKRTVVCLNDGEFGKVKAMSVRYNILERYIRSICSQEKGWISKNGLFFVWSDRPLKKDERLSLLLDRELKIKNRNNASRLARSKPVICTSNGVIYSSGAEAARKCNLSPMRIVQLCRDGGQTRKGLKFAYGNFVGSQS